MKSKQKEKKSEYTQMKRKLFSRLAGTVLLAFGAVYFSYILLWKGRGGDWVVSVLQRFFYMDEWSALLIYQRLFRDHVEIFWLISFFVIFLVLVYVVVHRFSHYFEQVDEGIIAILSEDKNIELPPEMVATERKLTAVKDELQRRTLEAKLAEQRKNDLVMYLAHDIRTPLTSVIGYLSLLEEAPDMPAEQKAKYIGITLEKAYRLEHMINEFFEITRYNLQQIQIAKEPIDLYYMLVQLIDELAPVLQKNGNNAVLSVSEDLVIYADPDKLARVFQNVLKNASVYSFADTEICISAEEKGKSIEIVFSNKGHTIPQHKLENIFEKFYRLDDARSTHSGGSGLGLAISKEIISLHGGTIAAESENNTVSFTITLPAL